MTDLLERVKTADHDDRFNMPYTPASKSPGVTSFIWPA